MQRLPLLIRLILSLAIFSACGGGERDAELDTNVQEITPVPASTEVESAPTALILTPATHVVDNPPVSPEEVPVLPAPVYYLNDEGQIIRLQQDGFSQVQITDEARPIDSFDVFGGGGQIVFVSDNKLIEFDAEGNRTVKVDGEPLDPDDFSARLNREIVHPLYSPDGTKIAFGLNGINIIRSGNATNYVNLIQSDPLPGPQEAPEEPPLFYRQPTSWSPDGARLVAEVAYGPEAGGLVLIDSETGALNPLTSNEEAPVLCCRFTWANDSRFGVVASNLIAYGEPGLSIVDAATGEAETIINGHSDSAFSQESPTLLLRAPFIDSDGRVFAFVFPWVGDEQKEAYLLSDIDLSIGTSLVLNKRPISSRGDIIWAPDGSGALIVEGGKESYPYMGPLVWIPSDGDTVTELAAVGRNLRWSVAGNLPSQPEKTQPKSAPATATSNASLPESDIGSFAELTEQFKADFDLRVGREDGFEAVKALLLESSPLSVDVDEPLWAVFTTGSRLFEKEERGHVVAIYRQDGEAWSLLAERTLDDDTDPDNLIYGPDYVSDFSLQQVSITTGALWLSVDGGAGAHSGIYQILRFDGTDLSIELTGFSSSPGAGLVVDLNGDDVGEVLLDTTDYYVFCYACNVREAQTEIMRWTGAEFEPVSLTLLPQDAPQALRDLNNLAVAQAQAGLWQNAVLTVEDAQTLGSDNETFIWNSAYISTNADARKNAIGTDESGLPLLGNIFYGDYGAAVGGLRSYKPDELFSRLSSALRNTPAESSLETLGERMETELMPALELEPDIAAARFLLGWALWLQDPLDESSLVQLQRAAELDTADLLYTASAAYLSENPASAETTSEANSADSTSSTGRLYFSAVDEDGVSNIYAQLLDEVGLQAGPSKMVDQAIQPRLDPTGSVLAFHSTRDDMLGLGGYELINQTRLRYTSNLEDSYPVWNSVGDELLFASNRESDRAWRLYRGEADGSETVEVLGFGQEPDWHPGKERIVYRGCGNSGETCGLWTVAVNGEDLQLLTDNPGDSRPRWSTDGNVVLFASNQRDGNWEIYWVDVASGAVTRVTENPAIDGAPVFSPDGTSVAFLSNRDESWAIYTRPLTGGAALPTVMLPGNLPDWSVHGIDWAR